MWINHEIMKYLVLPWIERQTNFFIKCVSMKSSASFQSFVFRKENWASICSTLMISTCAAPCVRDRPSGFDPTHSNSHNLTVSQAVSSKQPVPCLCRSARRVDWSVPNILRQTREHTSREPQVTNGFCQLKFGGIIFACIILCIFLQL